MKRIILAGITSLTGLGGYLVCSAPDCEDPGYLTVNVVEADGEGGFKPAKVDAVEYVVRADPRDGDELDRQLTQVLNATCLDDACTSWQVAPGDNGEITVKTDACGQTFENVALVERDADGCSTGDSTVQLVVDLSACPPDGDADADGNDKLDSHVKQCTQEARPSIELHTWRRNQDFFAPARPGKVSYEFGGPRERRPEPTCIDEDCTVWSIGTELPGTFDVVVEACEQTQEVRVEVPMTQDGCHVDTQRLDVVLEGTGCLAAIPTPRIPDPPVVDPNRDAQDGKGTITSKPIGDPPLPPEEQLDIDGSCTKKAVERPAFIAHLVKLVEGDMYVPVPAKRLTYSIDEPRRALPAKCTDEPCSDWIGDMRRPGVYHLTATVCGEDQKLTVPVGVSEDGCGVETQSIMWEVDTTNCLSNEPVDAEPPSPAEDQKPI